MLHPNYWCGQELPPNFLKKKAAEKLKISVEKLKRIESGEETPSFSLAEKMSKLYRRPLAVFYLPEPPKDFDTLRDFRGRRFETEISTALTFFIRGIREKQDRISEIKKEEGDEKLRFLNRFNTNNSEIEVAESIVQTFVPEDKKGYRKNSLKEWITWVEQKGIFVSVTKSFQNQYPIEIDDARGFAIYDPYAPFIFINGRDSENAKMFTLIHELAHLWIGESGISDINLYEPSVFAEDEFSKTERFCNRVAANVLMPETFFKEQNKRGVIWDHSVIEENSKKLGVSSYAMLIRLFELRMINKSEFKLLKDIIQDKYQKFLLQQAEKSAGAQTDYYRVVINRNSKSFSQFVYYLYRSGRIQGVEASNLLGVKLNLFDKLKSNLIIQG